MIKYMKNIHILPTLQPSRLRIGDNRNFIFGLAQSAIVSKNDSFTNQNIYITSDEEIKDGEYGLSKLNEIIKFHSGYDYRYYAKIILTTDNKDLIKDGVQAIDDEFLEWFVKNPSCEEVKVELIEEIPSGFTFGMFGNDEPPTELVYKIIIPQEEPKQEPCDNCNNDVCCCIIRTQETLEEAKLRQLFKNRSNCYADADDVVQAMDENCFIETIKEWQQERSYSEEEMLLFAKFVYTDDGSCVDNDGNVKKETLEQFKKEDKQ